MTQRHRSGMTLVEMLVAMSLLALVSSLVMFLVRPGWRAWIRGARKSEAQQACLVTLTRLTQEYRNALASSALVTADPPADDPDQLKPHRDSLVFLSNVDSQGTFALAPDGDPLWQRWVYLYLDNQGQVRVQEQALNPPTTLPPLESRPHLVPSERDRIVARCVRSLRVDDRASPLLEVTVEAESEGFSSRQQSGMTPLIQSSRPYMPQPSAAAPPAAP